jgi:hypothetical protein
MTRENFHIVHEYHKNSGFGVDLSGGRLKVDSKNCSWIWTEKSFPANCFLAGFCCWSLGTVLILLFCCEPRGQVFPWVQEKSNCTVQSSVCRCTRRSEPPLPWDSNLNQHQAFRGNGHFNRLLDRIEASCRFESIWLALNPAPHFRCRELRILQRLSNEIFSVRLFRNQLLTGPWLGTGVFSHAVSNSKMNLPFPTDSRHI